MRQHPVNHALQVVSEHFGVSVADIRSTRRTSTIHPARVWGMYLASVTTDASPEEIGKRFGGRNYTIVRMCARSCARAVESNGHSAVLFRELKTKAERFSG